MVAFKEHFMLLRVYTIGAYPGGTFGAVVPLKPTKIAFFTMILSNSENTFRDIWPLYRKLFCHSSVVWYT